MGGFAARVIAGRTAIATATGKQYRLLKIVTQPATPEQMARLGNDRTPVVVAPKTDHGG